LNDLGNEYHFVLICPMYNHLRTTYIKNNTTSDVRVYAHLLNCLRLQINLP